MLGIRRKQISGALRHVTFSYPRRSSDYAFSVSGIVKGQQVTIAMAVDTIGHPKISHLDRFIKGVEKQWKIFLDDHNEQPLDRLMNLVDRELLRYNRTIMDMNSYEEPIFGFCMAMAVIYGNVFQVRWLGDCRAYHLHWEPEPEPGYAFRYMTDDHNALHETLKNQGTFGLFKNEMLELSRQLVYYWGMPDQQVIEQVLLAQHGEYDLPDHDAMLLCTDGFYLPIARGLVIDTNYHLSKDIFYLESWMRQFFAAGAFCDGAPEKTRWQDFVKAVQHACQEFTTHSNRYQDDMAATLVFK